MLTAMCTLLRIQLHVLARSILLAACATEQPENRNNKRINQNPFFQSSQPEQSSTTDNNNSSNSSSGTHELTLDDDMFRILIEGTYKHMFGEGLIQFTQHIRQQLSPSRKIAVTYEEMIQLLVNLRQEMEDAPHS